MSCRRTYVLNNKTTFTQPYHFYIIIMISSGISLLELEQNTFYNRETIAALQQMSNTHLSFHATQIITPFLNSSISAIHDKVKGLSANGEILIKVIVSLLLNLLCWSLLLL